MCYLLLITESEGRTGRILPEVVQQRLRAIFSQKKFYIIWLCLTLYYLKSEPWRIGMNEQFTGKHTKLSSFIPHKKFILHPGWGGGALHYMSYIGMCGAKGQGSRLTVAN